MTQPILVSDNVETYVVYPDEPAYRYLKETFPAQKNGVRYVASEHLGLFKGWGWWTAMQKVEDYIQSLGIDWKSIELPTDLYEMPREAIAEYLVRASGYLTYVGQQLIFVEAKVRALEESLAIAIPRLVGMMEGGNGKATKDVKTAQAITSNQTVRRSKHELIETLAVRDALQRAYATIEQVWRTCSRVIALKHDVRE